MHTHLNALERQALQLHHGLDPELPDIQLQGEEISLFLAFHRGLVPAVTRQTISKAIKEGSEKLRRAFIELRRSQWDNYIERLGAKPNPLPPPMIIFDNQKNSTVQLGQHITLKKLPPHPGGPLTVSLEDCTTRHPAAEEALLL